MRRGPSLARAGSALLALVLVACSSGSFSPATEDGGRSDAPTQIDTGDADGGSLADGAKADSGAPSCVVSCDACLKSSCASNSCTQAGTLCFDALACIEAMGCLTRGASTAALDDCAAACTGKLTDTQKGTVETELAALEACDTQHCATKCACN